MKSIRIEKISEQLRRELAPLIQQEFGEEFGLISVTRIYVTPDIKEAKVYFTTLEPTKEEDLLKKLKVRAPHYQHLIGRKLKIKFTPVILFVIDDYQTELSTVEKRLQEIKDGA